MKLDKITKVPGKVILKVLIISMLGLIIGCENPFFPPIGIPLNSISLENADDLPREIERIYEAKRLDLFDSLIYSNTTFRFYIQNNPAKIVNLKNTNTGRMIHLDNAYVPGGDYFYLGYDEEIRVHKKLFDARNEIVFPESFKVRRVAYTVLPTKDSLAVITTESTKISISSDVIQREYGQRTYTFEVSPQVFVLKRDAKKNWRIYEWYELNLLN